MPRTSGGDRQVQAPGVCTRSPGASYFGVGKRGNARADERREVFKRGRAVDQSVARAGGPARAELAVLGYAP